jgi:hypothetical protein
MTKSDLKTGMLFQCRNSDIYLVMNDYAISTSKYFRLKTQNEDLTDANPNFDIMIVSNVLTGADLMPINWNEQIIAENLLWERDKSKETIEIGGITYDKSEFEQAVKNLKPINK